MKNNQNLKSLFPEWVSDEAIARVFSHYEDGVFTFDLPDQEITSIEKNTVYHVIPRYAGEDAENIVQKLRRIMTYELQEPEH